MAEAIYVYKALCLCFYKQKIQIDIYWAEGWA